MRAVVAAGAMLMFAVMVVRRIARIFVSVLTTLHGMLQSGERIFVMNLAVAGGPEKRLRLTGEERQHEEQPENAVRNHGRNIDKGVDSCNRRWRAAGCSAMENP
jgi:hypothetical protein